MSKLVVLTGSLAGLSHELNASWTTVGRAEGNTFQIAHASVSGRHCEILLRGEEIVVSDLNSTNGTFVRDERITKAMLKPGQTLRLGEVELRLEASPIRTASPIAPAKTGGEHRSGKKHQVLFVDDDQAFLEAITALYDILGDGTWEIHRAASADQALVLLKERNMDLVVLDIGMPVLDGVQLLQLIHRRYPDIKKAVLTGAAGGGHREACLAGGAELFIQKPVSSEGMKAVFTTLNELISWAQREGFSGMLRQVSLPDVIQMECIGRNASILEVRNQHAQGEIYIENGAVVHAVAGNLTGDKAFYRLLSLTGGEFRLQPFRQPPERTIHSQWEFLLIEAARIHDEEATALISRLSLATQTPVPGPAAESSGTSYDGQWRPADGAARQS